mgnify:CR=1 FL=1
MSPRRREPLGVEQALLGFFCAGPLHGYALLRALREPGGLGAVWRVKPGLLYAHLVRLEAEGLLHAGGDAPEGAGRKVYALTGAGRERFDAWRRTPVARPRDFRLHFMVKWYWARETMPAARALTDGQRRACSLWLAVEREAESRTAGYERQVHSYRAGQIEALLAWLERCVAEWPPA